MSYICICNHPQVKGKVNCKPEVVSFAADIVNNYLYFTVMLMIAFNSEAK